jgi:hypothetical protein
MSRKGRILGQRASALHGESEVSDPGVLHQHIDTDGGLSGSGPLARAHLTLLIAVVLSQSESQEAAG